MPWKSKTQLPEASSAATTPALLPARRAPSSAINGTLATANTSDTARNAVNPPPRWTTSQARAKCSGAPPRSVTTVRRTWLSEPRPTKSASASSSWGGHSRRNQPSTAARAAVTAAVPAQNSWVSPTRKRARANDEVRAVSSITGSFSSVSKPIALLASLILVPTYEYKCPNGHVFEIFKRIADPPPEACPVCGASPVQTVLYPVPVHFRGSGFYSTDYGRGGRKKEPAKESGDSSGDDKKKDTTSTEKKAAEA